MGKDADVIGAVGTGVIAGAADTDLLVEDTDATELEDEPDSPLASVDRFEGYKDAEETSSDKEQEGKEEGWS